MAQIFGPQSNWIARVSLVGLPVVVLLAFAIAEAVDRSGYVTGVGEFVDQPIPFSHQHHVGQLKIDCRFCHTQVEKSSMATLPGAEVCITCHSQIWKNAPMLEPVRESARTGVPIRWNRVTPLPQFVYFNHGIHIQKGVACTSCHGDVSTMPLTRSLHAMTMQFCLDCHRDPQKRLAPRDRIFDPKFSSVTLSGEDMNDLEKSLVDQYHVQPRTDCTTCHR